MKKIKRKDEENKKSLEDKKNTLFVRLVSRFRNSNAEIKYAPFRTPVQTENLVHKSSIIRSTEINAERDKWMKKRGFSENNELNDLAKKIFRLCAKNNEIKATSFLLILLEIGIPLQEFVIKATLTRLFRIHKFEDYLINENDMVTLCKSDSFTSNLLSILLENVEKVMKTNNSVMITEPNYLDFEKYEVSTADFEKLLRIWWKELDVYNRDQIHINEISEFLEEKTIVADQNEGRKMLFHLFKDLNFINFAQFTMIFSKTIIRWGLKILCDKIKTQENHISNDYSLTLIKKKLLLAGVNFQVNDFTQNEGKIALKNIEKHRENNNSPSSKITYEEFCDNWSENTGFDINKIRKVVNKEKVKKENDLSVFYSKNDFENSENENFDNEKFNGSEFYLKREDFSILGKFDINGKMNGKWGHSISKRNEEFKVKNAESNSKIKEQNQSFSDFQRICNYDKFK